MEMAQSTVCKKICWGRVGIVGWRNWEVIAFKTFCCTARAQEQKINYSSHTENEWSIVSVGGVYWNKISSWGKKYIGINIIIIFFICFLITFQNSENICRRRETKLSSHLKKKKKSIMGLEFEDVWHLAQRKN